MDERRYSSAVLHTARRMEYLPTPNISGVAFNLQIQDDNHTLYHLPIIVDIKCENYVRKQCRARQSTDVQSSRPLEDSPPTPWILSQVYNKPSECTTIAFLIHYLSRSNPLSKHLFGPAVLRALLDHAPGKNHVAVNVWNELSPCLRGLVNLGHMKSARYHAAGIQLEQSRHSGSRND